MLLVAAITMTPMRMPGSFQSRMLACTPTSVPSTSGTWLISICVNASRLQEDAMPGWQFMPVNPV